MAMGGGCFKQFDEKSAGDTTRPSRRRGHQEQAPLLVQEVILGCHLLLGGNYIYGAKRWEPYAQELDRVRFCNSVLL